jgi:virginiamycin B lyase
MRTSRITATQRVMLMGVVAAIGIPTCRAQSAPGTITEFPIAYPNKPQTPPARQGSTHEVTYNESGGASLWVTAPNYDALVEVGLNGAMRFYPMPAGSAPHGIAFDKSGRIWLSFEGSGQIAQLDSAMNVARTYDVQLDCTTCPEKINSGPHGMGFANDGETLWFTGKSTGTVGKITPQGRVVTYAVPTGGSVPIYIKAGPDGNMWFVELIGNKIGRITPEGAVKDFAIPTPNSRPIAIVPEPGGRAMWFTEEAGNKVGRIDMDGNITEFAIPKLQDNVILAGLAFDRQKNLWVQQYVDQNHPGPAGPDHLIRVSSAILTAGADVSAVPVTFYEVPTRNTVMHRVVLGPDGNMWFTELKADAIGRLVTPGVQRGQVGRPR